jgi:hypothetical protein
VAASAPPELSVTLVTLRDVEQIQRWREPAVVVVAAALLVHLVLVLVFAGTAARLGLNAPAEAVYLASRQLGEPTLFVVLAALVTCCWLAPVTRHARALTTVALVLAGLSALLALVLAFVGFRSYSPPFSQLDFLDRLVGLVVPLLVVGLLVVLRRRSPAAAAALTAGSAPPAAAGPPPSDAPEPRPDPELAPTWQPDEAAGAAWHTAGDAASGRPAAGWGSPGAAGSWSPAPQLPASTPPPAPPGWRPPQGEDPEPDPWRAGRP